MTNESPPGSHQETEYDREIVYANEMYAAAEERLAETLGIDVDALRGVDPKRIANQANEVAKWAMQIGHYSRQRQFEAEKQCVSRISD